MNLLPLILVVISVLGNGTIVFDLPQGYDYYLIYYRLPEENTWTLLANTTNTTLSVDLPYGKYIFNVKGYVNDTAMLDEYYIIENKPRYLWDNSLILLALLVIVSAIAVLKKSVLFYIAGIGVYAIYLLNVLKYFDPQIQVLSLILYITGIGYATIARR